MVSLGELASWIHNTSTLLYGSLQVILEISCFIGQALVNQFLMLLVCGKQLLEQAIYVSKIIYEDSGVFIQDIGQKCSSILKFLADSTAALANGVIEGSSMIANGVQNMITFMHTIFLIFGSSVQNVLSFIQKSLILLKQGFSLIRASIWLGICAVPDAIKFCSNFLFESATNVLDGLQTWFLVATQLITESIQSLFNFIFDVLIESIFGLVLGLIFLYLIVRSFGTICSLIFTISNKVYFCTISFCNNLWTGRFLDSKRPTATIIQPVIAQPAAQNEEKLCVVCQDQVRDVIILPCRHMCLCLECSEEIRRRHRSCPVCRSYVRRTLRVYT